MSTTRSWSRGGRREVDEVRWSWKVMEMGWGTDKDKKGKRGGCTMTQVWLSLGPLPYPMKMGRKPREGILCQLPCLILRVRAMSEAQPKGCSNLSSRCAMNVLMKRSGSLALATPLNE